MMTPVQITNAYVLQVSYKIDKLEAYKTYLEAKIKYLDPIDSEVSSGNQGIEEIDEKLKQILNHINIMLDACYNAKDEIYNNM